MKAFSVRRFLFILVGLVLILVPHGKADVPASARPAIYDENADGEKQVAAAVATAKAENKRVLLQYGANWCIWCHRLHGLLQSDQALHDELQKNYVFVLIDVNKGHNQATDDKYGHPAKKGLPALAVLDADGKLLTTKDTSELEEGDHHSPAKVMAFLQDWAPKR